MYTSRYMETIPSGPEKSLVSPQEKIATERRNAGVFVFQEIQSLGNSDSLAAAREVLKRISGLSHVQNSLEGNKVYREEEAAANIVELLEVSRNFADRLEESSRKYPELVRGLEEVSAIFERSKGDKGDTKYLLNTK